MEEAAPGLSKSGFHTRRAIMGSAITGLRVLNRQGEDIGNVEEIVVDQADGRAIYFVLSFGGFLGLGTKLYAVPWNRLRFDESRTAYVIDLAREQIENAPYVLRHDLAPLFDADWNRRLIEYFDALPAWNL